MFKRILMGVTFALILGFVTFAVTQAKTEPEVYGSDDCGDCHEAVTAQWENSVHGHASVAEGFWLLSRSGQPARMPELPHHWLQPSNRNLQQRRRCLRNLPPLQPGGASAENNANRHLVTPLW